MQEAFYVLNAQASIWNFTSMASKQCFGATQKNAPGNAAGFLTTMHGVSQFAAPA